MFADILLEVNTILKLAKTLNNWTDVWEAKQFFERKLWFCSLFFSEENL